MLSEAKQAIAATSFILIRLYKWYNIKMEDFLQMKIFFLISSLGFIVLFILVSILIIYLIRISHTSSRILDKAEKGIDELSEGARNMLEDLENSILYRFFFKKKRRSKLKE